MKTIAGAFLGSVMAIQAGAQDRLGYPAPETVLSSDDSVQVLLYESKQTNANGFLVLCPGYKMREIYSHKASQAVVIVTDQDIKTLENGLKNAGLYASDKHYPLANSGFIYPGNVLDPAYTFKELGNKTRDVLDKPDPLAGSNARDSDLIKKLRNHAENFCFARF